MDSPRSSRLTTRSRVRNELSKIAKLRVDEGVSVSNVDT